MGIKTYIQLALGFIQLANWIAGRISKAEWEQSGYAKAAAKYSKQFDETTGAANAAMKEANKMTPEERRRLLEGE